MSNSGRVLLMVLNLHVQIKIRVGTFNTNHSITHTMQIVHCYISPEDSYFKGTHGQCVFCFRTFNNSSLALAKLSRHFQIEHS